LVFFFFGLGLHTLQREQERGTHSAPQQNVPSTMAHPPIDIAQLDAAKTLSGPYHLFGKSMILEFAEPPSSLNATSPTSTRTPTPSPPWKENTRNLRLCTCTSTKRRASSSRRGKYARRRDTRSRSRRGGREMGCNVLSLGCREFALFYSFCVCCSDDDLLRHVRRGADGFS
jgi:hypothetical protein